MTTVIPCDCCGQIEIACGCEKLPPGTKVRVIGGPGMFHGQFQFADGGWQFACSSYGKIRYTTAAYARAGAIVCAMNEAPKCQETVR